MRKVDKNAFRIEMLNRGYEIAKQLEEKTGINSSMVSTFMTGARKPSYGTISKIADALELDSETIGRIFFAS